MMLKMTSTSKRAITSEEILRSDRGVVEGDDDDVEGDVECDNDVKSNNCDWHKKICAKR